MNPSRSQLSLYRSWHRHDPRWERTYKSEWGPDYGLYGIVEAIIYWSDRGESPDPATYKHDFDSPAKVYLDGHDGAQYRGIASLPEKLTVLGEARELWIVSDEGQEALRWAKGDGYLCAKGRGGWLCVVEPRRKIIPVILTGPFKVTERGIVG